MPEIIVTDELDDNLARAYESIDAQCARYGIIMLQVAARQVARNIVMDRYHTERAAMEAAKKYNDRQDIQFDESLGKKLFSAANPTHATMRYFTVFCMDMSSTIAFACLVKRAQIGMGFAENDCDGMFGADTKTALEKLYPPSVSEMETESALPELTANIYIESNVDNYRSYGTGMVGRTEFIWFDGTNTTEFTVENIKWVATNKPYDNPTRGGRYEMTNSPVGAQYPILVNTPHEALIRVHLGWISMGCLVFGRSTVASNVYDSILSHVSNHTLMYADMTVIDERSAEEQSARPLPYTNE